MTKIISLIKKHCQSCNSYQDFKVSEVKKGKASPFAKIERIKAKV